MGLALGVPLAVDDPCGRVFPLFRISYEYHQSFVIGRSATLADGLVNSVAATVSAALLWTLFNRARNS